MPAINIFIGNIGSGKSILARKLAFRGDVVFNMDSFQQMIAGGEYGQYDNAKKEIYQEAENFTIRKALEKGFGVVIDRTNMDIKKRKRFLDTGKEFGCQIVAYNWGPGTDINLKNRMKNPRGIPETQWKEVFEFMKKSFEPPTTDEGFSDIIEAPKKFRFYAFDFDGEIVENKFPKIGEIINGTVEKLNSIYTELSNIIIIWTCRSGDFESQMRKFLITNKIPFDFINENPIFDTGSRKIFAHEYYDDRGIL